MKLSIIIVLLISFGSVLPAAYSSVADYHYHNRIILYGMIRAAMDAPLARFHLVDQPAAPVRRHRRDHVIQCNYDQRDSQVRAQQKNKYYGNNNNKANRNNNARVNMRIQQPRKHNY